MRGLRKKLKDQGGASILLALLFFLLCSMVGASVLMAAVSNAGKIRSNREEQQKYLLLSSALRLVCDELTKAEYSGAFEETGHTVEVLKVGEDGNVVLDENEHPVISYIYTYEEYTQKTGSFTCELSDVLPLLPELDYIFAKTFPAGGGGEYQGDDIYKPMTSNISSPGAEHELTLSVDTPETKGLNEDVTVKLLLDENYSIRLTAALGENDAAYTMEAQLTPYGTNPDMVSKETGERKWKLEWIAKKEAGG